MNIQEKFNHVISIFKKRHERNNKEKPEYYPGYEIACEWRERIMVHSEATGFPAKLFLHRSPNMTEKEFHYVKENFKRVTLPIFMDYLSVISRATIDSNWTIQFSQEDSKFSGDLSLEKYLEDIKLEGFWKLVVPSIMSKDANGVICIKPMYEFERDNEGNYLANENGEYILDETQLPEPKPIYYSCDRVMAYEPDELAIILTDEKSEVIFGNRKVMEGLVFEIYTDDSIMRVSQYGNKIDYLFKWEYITRHELDFFPVKILGGVPNILENNNRIIYQSPFLFSTDILDLVLLNSSNLQVSINSCVYPYRVMVGYPCEFENEHGKCDGGILRSLKGDGGLMGDCPSCHGSGLKDRVSPSGVLLLNPKERGEDGEAGGSKNHLYYVSPETHTLEFLEEKIAKDESRARSILHLQTSNSSVKGQENMTATGMAIDVKSMYSFIKNISDQLFGIYSFMIDGIGLFRYGAEYVQPTIVPPVIFDFKTEDDYMTELSNAIKNGLPPYIIHTIVYKFINTYFYSDKTTADVFKLIMFADRLVVKSEGEIQMGLNNGTIERWESVLHDSAIYFVQELMTENPKFFEQELEPQQEQLIDKAKTRADQIKQVGADDTQNIIKNIIEE